MSLMHHVRQMMMPQPEGDVALSEEDVERIAALIYPRRSWSYYYTLLGRSAEAAEDLRIQ